MSQSTLPRWAQIFIPTRSVKVTPVIISANILVWLIMIATGVSPLFPETDVIRAWGASSTIDVNSGDYWRLWTSNYLHYGIIHLAVNMLSLNNVGRMLEQFIGPWRFALIYTATGICASAISIWWNPYAIGVGASGAILGIVGILLAILTTPLIEKKARFSMLRSMAISAGLMIIISFQANVDNAAHLGGLATGMLCGYFIFPELKAFYYERKKQYVGLIAGVLVTLGAAVWFVIYAPEVVEVRTIEQMNTDFNTRETKAESDFQAGKFTTPEAIDKNVIEVYRYGLRQLDSVDPNELNEDAVRLQEGQKTYRMARLIYYHYQSENLRTGNTTYSDSVAYWDSISLKAKKSMYSR